MQALIDFNFFDFIRMSVTSVCCSTIGPFYLVFHFFDFTIWGKFSLRAQLRTEGTLLHLLYDKKGIIWGWHKMITLIRTIISRVYVVSIYRRISTYTLAMSIDSKRYSQHVILRITYRY